MGRPKEIVDSKLALEAQKQLKNFKKHKVYLRLLAIAKCGEHNILEVASFLNVSRQSISNWAKRFRKNGIAGLEDLPKGHKPSKLNEKHKEAIAQWLTDGQNSKGEPVNWTLEKLRAEIKLVFNISITNMPLWRQLKIMGFKLKVARPSHTNADPKAQAAFKKNS